SKMIENYLPFISYAPVHFTSAQTGYGVESMVDDAIDISYNLRQRVSTGVLNDAIRRAVGEHPPASVKGQQVKVRYATQAESSPPTIIIFVNKPDLLHFSYVRYLENTIRAKFPFRGVPLRIELRRGSGTQTKEERLKTKREAGLAETARTDEERREAKRQQELEAEGEVIGEEVFYDEEDGDFEDLDDDDFTEDNGEEEVEEDDEDASKGDKA
ncbi:MAG: GTPase, partial [Abditibacteriota bacterium]|nr:GTPase [Abditibacteriota bacterium]